MGLSSIVLFLVIAALITYLFIREEKNRVERQDLMDRLMSKDFVEYKESVSEPVEFEPVSMTEEQEYWKEIEDQKV
jgi:hypothetical protein